MREYFKEQVRYIVEWLRYSAFILEFNIAFDIILICVTGDCFINKLKLRDPFKSTRYSPQYGSSGFLPIDQCNVNKFARVLDTRWEYVCKRNRFRVWNHLKR